ncbi:MAG: hypothetical protein GXY45_11665 [Ramlibacter sp.]|nr:hypothetical protein [Ramlibacter sp.]
MKFIGYTIGLECNGHGRIGKMVTIEINKNVDGTYRLNAVSGRNLASMQGSATLTPEQYDNLPNDPYNDAARAIAMLKLCGWTPMALDD